jgi:hypothetical protein
MSNPHLLLGVSGRAFQEMEKYRRARAMVIDAGIIILACIVLLWVSQ